MVETAGVSLRQKVVRTDLRCKAACPQGDCMLCITNPGQGGGPRHHSDGSIYTGTRQFGQEDRGEDFTAVYTGETGFSAYARTLEHKDDVLKKKEDNAFAKHLAEYHPANQDDTKAFKFTVEKTFRKPMERHVSEVVAIHSSSTDLALNSK